MAARTAPPVDMRVVFEPLFVTYGVNVVFAGHDHIYERITPQKGICTSSKGPRDSCGRETPNARP